MNPLALELNQQLEGTAALRLFSSFGTRIFFPKGIVAQAAEASAHAHLYDATIGMAVSKRQPILLDCIREQVPDLSPREIAAYAPTTGYSSLRETWKQFMLKKNPSLKSAACSLPVVVPGLTNGIFQTAELFAEKGDVVLLPDLAWDNYELIFGTRREADIRRFPLFNAAQELNCEAIDKLLGQVRTSEGRRKAIIILNFPNNPTGYSPDEACAHRLRDILVAHAEQGMDILAMCDDAYFGLYFEDSIFQESLFGILCNAHERILAVKIDGSTKEDLVWGLRIGFVTLGSRGCTARHYQALDAKLIGSIRASASSSSSLGQNLLSHAYHNQQYQQQKSEVFESLKVRYKTVKTLLATAKALEMRPVLDPLPFNSGYFMTFACKGIQAEELRQVLLKKGIGTIAFQGNYLRIAYSAVDAENLESLFGEVFGCAASLATR